MTVGVATVGVVTTDLPLKREFRVKGVDSPLSY